MQLDLSPESKALRRQLREYFAESITEEDRRDLVDQTEGGPTFDRIYQRMGADGWLGLGWPEEFGGRGEDPEALYVFYDEVIRANAPLSLVTLNTVAPSLMRTNSPSTTTSLTVHSAAARIFLSAATVNSTAASISTARMPRSDQRCARCVSGW